MSNEEKIEDAKKAASNIVSSLLKLKESNPKLLWGGIGAVVVLIIIIALSGDDGVIKPAGNEAQNLEIGKTYTLKEANSYDPNSVVRLVATPGSLAAFDDTEAEDRDDCSNVVQGVPVTILDFFDAHGMKRAYSKIKINSGECKDKTGC